MINLMPPDLKEQIRFAKMNRVALNYLWIMVTVVVVLAGVFAGANYLLVMQTNAIASDVSSKQQQIAGQRRELLPKATDASERLNAIKYVQDTQTKFSALIADLVKVLPQGVKLEGIALNGSDKAPVTLTVTSSTYDGVLALHNSLVTSPRIAADDIVSITGDGKSWNGTIIMSFKPGQAK